MSQTGSGYKQLLWLPGNRELMEKLGSFTGSGFWGQRILLPLPCRRSLAPETESRASFQGCSLFGCRSFGVSHAA